MASLTATVPLIALLLLFGCVTIPREPSMLVLPGTGKSVEQFRTNDVECRQFAAIQAGGATSNEATSENGSKRVIAGSAQHVSAVYARYDYGYLQCMYAKGHRIPVYLPPPPDAQQPPAVR